MGLFHPKKYSKRWFKRLSELDFAKERETVRLKHCNGDAIATEILELFNDFADKKVGKSYKKNPWQPPKHGSGGWYLPDDD